MNEQIREQIALFRYGLIAPLLNGQVNQKAYLDKVAKQTHTIPHYGERSVAPKTVQEWLLNYRRQGFDGLKPKRRSDRGRPRRLDPESEDVLLALRKQTPTMPVTVFYEQCVRNGDIQKADVSYTTVYRLLKKHRLVGREASPAPERKRFAYDTINTLWQGDLSHGPILSVDGKRRKTFLIALIDDCSRLVPFAQFFDSEKFDGLRIVTKQAMIRRGIPEKIYADNGKIYRSETLQFACAQLGIILTHTHPYDPQSKGKIERFFLTVQTRFYPLLQQNPVHSLEALNERFWRWLEEDYHRRVHASLDGKTPLQVYSEQLDRLRMVDDPATLDPIFLKRAYRKVKHDGTVSLERTLYEVPPRFIGRRVELRLDETAVFLYEDGEKVTDLQPVSFHDNAHVKREKSGLSFAKMTATEEIQGDV